MHHIYTSTPVCVYSPDETSDVDVHKGGHEVLTVKPVHDASMARDRVGKILKWETTRTPNHLQMLSNGHDPRSYSFFKQSNSACLWFFSLYLNLEGSLEAAGKEATKRPHDGGEAGESDAVDLERVEPHRGLWRQGRRHSARFADSDVQRMKRRKELILTHPVAVSRMLGRTYSWSWKSSDGSQSTWKLLESLLNSTGHTK